MKLEDEIRLTGTLDRCLSEMILATAEADLHPASRQTLKHHASDMIEAGKKCLENLKAIKEASAP